MVGNFAVVVHGPMDCLNVFLRHIPDGTLAPSFRPDFSSESFFCPDIAEMDIVLGRSLPKLEACIESILDRGNVEYIFVLDTCLTRIVGDDIEAVVAKFSGRKGVRIVAIPAGGLELRRQPELADAFYRIIISSLAGKKYRSRKGMLLVGISIDEEEVSEVREFAVAAGLEPLIVLKEFSTAKEWCHAASVALAAVVDAAAHPSLVSMLRRQGVVLVDVPPPFGIGGAMLFYNSLIEATGRRKKVEKFFAPLLREARQVKEKAKKLFQGKRVAYETGSILGVRPGQHAREGLSPASVFEEFGMTVEFIVQGVDSVGSRALIEERLAEMGMRRSFRIFQDPGRLQDLLAAVKYDLVCCSDGRKSQVWASHTPFLSPIAIRPFLTGVKKNAARIESVMNSVFFRRYGKIYE